MCVGGGGWVAPAQRGRGRPQEGGAATLRLPSPARAMLACGGPAARACARPCVWLQDTGAERGEEASQEARACVHRGTWEGGVRGCVPCKFMARRQRGGGGGGGGLMWGVGGRWKASCAAPWGPLCAARADPTAHRAHCRGGAAERAPAGRHRGPCPGEGAGDCGGATPGGHCAARGGAAASISSPTRPPHPRLKWGGGKHNPPAVPAMRARASFVAGACTGCWRRAL